MSAVYAVAKGYCGDINARHVVRRTGYEDDIKLDAIDNKPEMADSIRFLGYRSIREVENDEIIATVESEDDPPKMTLVLVGRSIKGFFKSVMLSVARFLVR